MVKQILAMNTGVKFAEVSRKLISAEARTQLYDSIVENGIALLSEDAWTQEQLATLFQRDTKLEQVLSDTSSEGDSPRVLHRLQLLGHFNPGIRRFIFQYLERACV